MDKYTLKAARWNVNMTQREAADKIGISIPTLSNYENGKSSPKLYILQKICEAYGITINQVIL